MKNLSSRRLKSISILIAIVLVVAGPGAWAHASLHRAPAQEDDVWTAIKTDVGVLFIWNRPGLSFTLTINGKEVRPMDDQNILFMVDGLVLQIQSVPLKNFAPDARSNKSDDKTILTAHRDWESAFIQNELLHKKITVKSEEQKLANGSQALIWQYDLPEDFRSPDAMAQMYVSAVAKDYVILLNGVINSTNTETVVRRFLLDKIATLKIRPGRIDVKELQEAIRKGEKP